MDEIKLREWQVPADKVKGQAHSNSVGRRRYCWIQSACMLGGQQFTTCTCLEEWVDEFGERLPCMPETKDSNPIRRVGIAAF